MLIDNPPLMKSKVIHITWERDPDTFNMLAIHTENNDSHLLGFPIRIFYRDVNAWYSRMHPEDKGRELFMLVDVYRKGKSKGRYRVLAKDGSEWQVTEVMEIHLSTAENRTVLHGKWICKSTRRN